MSGIRRIQSQITTREIRSNQPPTREVWFKDGDQVFVTPVCSGEDDDKLMDDLSLYTYKSGQRWVTLLSDPEVDSSDVPSNYRPSHKFAFWGYVHEIIHSSRRVDDWEEVMGPNGKAMYKETVNDFRVIGLGFGRSNYIWNQFSDVYNEWGGLDKGIVRVKRTGTGMYDTSYTLGVTARNEPIPDDKKAEIADLPAIKEYYMTRYGGQAETEGSTGEVVSTREKEQALF